MKTISLLFLFFFAVSCTNNSRSPIAEICISESGKSQYDVYINRNNKSGLLRYKFMGQDIVYTIYLTMLTDDLIEGSAHFHSSATGETKGGSIAFKYHPKKRMFEETNIKYLCMK